MRKVVGKFLSLLLCLSLLAAALPLCAVTAKAVVNPYHTGDTVFFGEYPQTRVTDEGLLAKLEKALSQWQPYPYSVGTGEYGTMARQDFMFYQDVALDGERYRAVLLRQYRPQSVYGEFPAEDSAVQARNGYPRETACWFRFEPVEWTVLDPVEGLLISHRILDAQPFAEKIYRETVMSDNGTLIHDFSDPDARIPANSYRSSWLREWLNGVFYGTAFSGPQQECIEARFIAPEDVHIAVKASPEAMADAAAATATEATATDGATAQEPPEAAPTEAPRPDPVFLLSAEEATSEAYTVQYEWGGSDSILRTQPTDYARSQGFSRYGDGWLLRTPGEDSGCAAVFEYGSVRSVEAGFTGMGVRPAINVNFSDCFAGDVDGDGEVSAADARLALRVSVGLTVIPAEWTVYADADGDGEVTSGDARLILRFSVSLEEESAMSHFFAPPQAAQEEVSNTGKRLMEEITLAEGASVSFGDRHLVRAGTAARWESSNPAVATVTQDGTVQALNKGFACVHLTAGTNRYYYFISVLSPLQQRIYALKDKYPAGYFWNSYPKSEKYPAVTETPCTDHATGAYSHCIGQCAGFAALLCDEIFGRSAPVKRNLTVADIRVGDYVRCLPHHSVFVIDRVNRGEIVGYHMYSDTNRLAEGDYITVAECNWDSRCGIRWGRMIDLGNLQIDSYETYTRY